jgi:hypothetical protein
MYNTIRFSDIPMLFRFIREKNDKTKSPLSKAFFRLRGGSGQN